MERMDGLSVMQIVDRRFSIDTSVPLNIPLKPAKSNLYSLATVWAKRYVVAVSQPDENPTDLVHTLEGYDSAQGRQHTEEKLLRVLRLASAQAWAQTEVLLTEEIYQHGIKPELINPWEIAANSHQVFEKAIQAYGQGTSAQHISLMIGNDCGKLRQKYCQDDARVIGFVSMQFHYTGQMLLEQLDPVEHLLFAPYLKVMDDHLYMPLRDAYLAAAEYDVDSETLRAVQRLLAVSTRIARKVYKRVKSRHPGYHSHSGSLGSAAVRVSSIRDIEMFQVYLCLCLLEGNIRSVQEQLFPLCVMLYPRLNVSWDLVQEMLETMGWEMHKRLLPGDMMQFLPYLRTLSHMFSREVFEGGGAD
jgi:Phycobilisome protein